MTSFFKTAALAFAALFAWAGIANAVPITLTIASSGSGSIGTTNFGQTDFVITSLGNTDNRIVGMSGPNPLIELVHDSASISIDGVGTFDFITSMRTFVVGLGPNTLVGLSRTAGGDVLNGPVLAGAWDMLSGIGPVVGTANIFQWSLAPVLTDGGILFFDDDGAAPTTFTASVPLPGAALLLGVGLLGLAARRQRLI